MENKRFVPVKRVITLLKKRDELDKEIELFTKIPHCRVCGDTKPKHNFYPLFSMAIGKGIYQTSSMICNRCAISNKDYIKYFGEPKEKVNKNE